jgi:lipoprotein-anchoring transpeptidase ErfK/SrfK
LQLFVLYGGWIALNGNDTPLKVEEEFGDAFQQVITPGPIGPSDSSTAGNTANAFDMFNSAPSKGFGASTPANPSPFGAPANLDLTNPSMAFPSPSSPSLQAAPLLSPPTGNAPPGNPPQSNTAQANTLPPLASVAPNLIPSFTSNAEDKKEMNSSSLPISTNASNLSVNAFDTKPSNDFPPSSNGLSSVTPLPALDPTPNLELPSATNSVGTSSSPITSAASKSYENAKDLAMEQIDRRNLKDALATLSVFYNAAELTTEQRQDLLDLLDALSREVVFSRQHLLELAYIVAPGETLEQVAKQHNLPAEILARINALDPSAPLRSGEKLKIVPGPFRAEVDLAKNELTIFVGDLYAGRYPVTFGAEPSPIPGIFQVVGKEKNKNYYGNGVPIPATDPRNPFGGYWIDLGQDLCIHGSTSAGPADSKLGCISLSPMDANDVYGMLGSGSQVTIRR